MAQTCERECCCTCSDCVGVVGSECMQVAKLTQPTLNVCHMDLNIILEATVDRGNRRTIRTLNPIPEFFRWTVPT